MVFPFACTRMLLLLHSTYWDNTSVGFVQLKTWTEDATGLTVGHSKICLIANIHAAKQQFMCKSPFHKTQDFKKGSQHLTHSHVMTVQTKSFWSLNWAAEYILLLTILDWGLMKNASLKRSAISNLLPQKTPKCAVTTLTADGLVAKSKKSGSCPVWLYLRTV